MKKFKILLSVVLVAGMSACSPEYIEPLAQRSEKGSVMLRDGESALSSEKAPLIVVNGKIAKREALRDMDPDSIVSISVLKGPNAAAFYGSKAKNGVVLITLKD